MNRRDFLAASAAAGASRAYGAQRRPNVLFIMVDEMRWDAMGCEKHPVVETPNLDKLAREGSRFARAYTVSPVCCPARASVFTGRYAHVHGVVENGVPAHAGEIFLPTVLRHYGYHTAIAGKLHYTPKEYAYGFDQFWSFCTEGPTPEIGYVRYLEKKHGSGAKFPIEQGTCPWPDDPLGRDVGRFKHPIGDFETEWITDRSVEYLRARKSSAQPWFLFTSYLKPHSPSVEPEPYFSKYDPAAMPVPKLPPEAKANRAKQEGRRKRQYIDEEQMMRVMTAKYYGAIHHVDAEVGRLLGELERLGMADNTVVLFTSDHGNMLGDRGRWFKDLHYEGSAHVPLLWRGPKGAAENGGGVVNGIVENTDLMPAILESAGIPVPEGVQGRSFLALARGKDPNWKNRCFSQLHTGMLLEGDYKLIDNSMDGSGPFELYNLREDPKEARNLANEPAQRERMAAFRGKLAAWRAEKPAPIRIAGLETPDYARLSEAARRQAIDAIPGREERRAKDAGGSVRRSNRKK